MAEDIPLQLGSSGSHEDLLQQPRGNQATEAPHCFYQKQAH